MVSLFYCCLSSFACVQLNAKATASDVCQTSNKCLCHAPAFVTMHFERETGIKPLPNFENCILVGSQFNQRNSYRMLHTAHFSFLQSFLSSLVVNYLTRKLHTQNLRHSPSFLALNISKLFGTFFWRGCKRKQQMLKQVSIAIGGIIRHDNMCFLLENKRWFYKS